MSVVADNEGSDIRVYVGVGTAGSLVGPGTTVQCSDG